MSRFFREWCGLCGSTPNECNVDEFPDLRGNRILLDVARKCCLLTVDRNVSLPTCIGCQRILENISEFSDRSIKVRMLLIDLRKSKLTNDDEILEFRNNFLKTDEVLFEDAEPEEVLVKVEVFKDEEPEELIEEILNNDPITHDQEVVTNDEKTDTNIKRKRRVLREVTPRKKWKKGTKCPTCGVVPRTHLDFKIHKATHKPQGHICDQCAKEYPNLSALQCHLLVHTDARPFQCPTCPMAFKTRRALKIHGYCHEELKIACPVCAKELKTPKTLNNHMAIHSDEKRFKCPQCQKGFKRDKALKHHLITHTGLRPYTCPFCLRTFVNGANCRSHKRKMHAAELAALEATGKTEITRLPHVSELKKSMAPGNFIID